MRFGYLYALHKEALRWVNNTCTKSEKKRKDAIIIPAFIAVFLTRSFLYVPSSSLIRSSVRSTHYHRENFSSQLCFQQLEPSLLSFRMQKDNQVEFTLSIHIMFPYTRYKVISQRQVYISITEDTDVYSYYFDILIIYTDLIVIHFSIHQYTFLHTLCIRVHYTSL